MMAVRSRQLDGANAVDTRRAEAASDRQRAENAYLAHCLAVAAGAACWQAGEVSRRRWYVLRVGSGAETAVENVLSAAGIEAWVAVRKVKVLVQGTRKKRCVEQLVWPGYVFVSIVPADEAWHGLRHVNGVRSVLGSAFGPVSVSDEMINDLKAMWADKVFDAKHADKVVRQGEKVRVRVGDYAEFEGVVEGYVGTRAVRVMASMFGSIRPIEVNLADLDRIGGAV